MSVDETRQRIIIIAKCYLGYKEGYNNDNLFGTWYGMPNQPWCAMFVSYCMHKAGVSENTVPKFAYCPTGFNWFANKGQTRDRNYVPQTGDIIFFDWEQDGVIDHVGIVDRVVNNIVYTVEGNHSDQVNIYSYQIGDSQIRGYAVPNYTGNEQIENSTTEAPSEMPLIYKGSTGEAVTYAQNKLISKGYILNYGADGIFGSETEQIVRQFQADNGLAVDGMIGPATWAKLEDPTTIMPSSYPGSLIGYGASGDNVKKVQDELIRRGYNVEGGADGIFGNGTKNAVITFQTDNGLDADGIVGKNTWDTLFPQSGMVSTYPGYIITMGARGENVVKIQQKLIALGYTVSGGVDGQYGYGVQAAVKQFQSDNGLSVDGDVGPITWDALFPKEQVSVSYPGYLMAYGMADDNIKLLQRRLSDLGYSVGSVDGIYGNNTKNAVTKFQSDRGLDADGIVGENTWNELFNAITPSTDPNNPTNSEDDSLMVESLKQFLGEEIIPYLDGIMNTLQKLKALRSRENTFAILMNYDDIVTKYSKQFKVRKSLIQTIIMWECGVEGLDDSLADTAVKTYYETGIGKNDCSTGICQIFASTAINAFNFAIDRGIITGNKMNPNNEGDLKTVWYQLNGDVDYNIKMASLNLLYCAYQKNGGYDYDTEEYKVKNILSRYNGTGEAANEYGIRNYGLYKIFEKYNEVVRAL